MAFLGRSRRFVRRSGARPKARRFFRKSRISRQLTLRRERAPKFFKRTYTVSSTINVNDSAPYLGSRSFILSDLPSYTEFTALFDRYKINGAKIAFYQPYQNGAATSVTQATTAVTTLPMIRLHTAVDYDDASTPSSVAVLEQYTSYKCVELTSPNIRGGKVTRYLKPRLAVSVYGGGVFGNYGNSKAMWIDTSSPSVNFYGIKWAYEPIYSDGVGSAWLQKTTIQVSVTLYFSCKDVS